MVGGARKLPLLPQTVYTFNFRARADHRIDPTIVWSDCLGRPSEQINKHEHLMAQEEGPSDFTMGSADHIDDALPLG